MLRLAEKISELRAEKSVTSNGGLAQRGYEWNSIGDRLTSRFRRYALKSLGANFWSPVESVMFSDVAVSSMTLRNLAAFLAVKQLAIVESKLPSDGLSILPHLSFLEELHLHGTNVCDADLKYLVKFERLRILTLEDTGVTDDGVSLLKQIDSLEWLCLAGTPVSEKSVRYLVEELPGLSVRWFNEDAKKAMELLEDLEPTFDSDAQGNVVEVTLWSEDADDLVCQRIWNFPHLRSLSLWCLSTPGKVTNAGLRDICNIAELQNLHLVGSQVDDMGVRYLDGLQNLSTLDLRGSLVSDFGAERLPPLPHLRKLDLSETKVTNLQVLRKKYPDCEIKA